MGSSSEIPEKKLRVYGRKKLSSWFLAFYLTSKRLIRTVSFLKREKSHFKMKFCTMFHLSKSKCLLNTSIVWKLFCVT